MISTDLRHILHVLVYLFHTQIHNRNYIEYYSQFIGSIDSSMCRHYWVFLWLILSNRTQGNGPHGPHRVLKGENATTSLFNIDLPVSIYSTNRTKHFQNAILALNRIWVHSSVSPASLTSPKHIDTCISTCMLSMTARKGILSQNWGNLGRRDVILSLFWQSPIPN